MDHKKTILLIMLLVPILLGCAADFISPTDGVRLHSETADALNLNKDWYWEQSDGSTEKIVLPIKLDAGNETTLRISHTFSENIIEEFNTNVSACIKTEHQAIEVFLDGEIIYSYGNDSSKFLGNSTGELWNLFDLPSDISGKTLTIELKAFYPKFSGIVHSVKFGSRSAIVNEFASDNILQLIAALVVFIIGAMLVALKVAFYGSKVKDAQVLYLGIFALIASFWMLAVSDAAQMFIESQFWIAWGRYLLLMLMPIPLLMFLDGAYDSVLPKFMNAQLIIYMICFLILNLLHFSGIASYYETIHILHSFFVVSITIFLMNMAIEIIKYKNKRAKRTFSMVFIFFLTGLFEIINFNTKWTECSVVAQTGIVLFVVFFGIESATRFREIQTETLKLQYYKELAYSDALTKGPNRMAYISKLEMFDENTAPIGMRLLMFDLNDLKKINDTYGHKNGDDALIKCYDCIKDIFGDSGDCYRIGGDEFACILLPCEQKKFEKMVESFEDEMKKETARTEHFFGAAIGYAMYTKKSSFNMDELIEEADKMLYKNKYDMKQTKLTE